MADSHSLPLNHCHVHKLWAILNRTYALLHFIALGAIFYYRGSFFFNKNDPKYNMVSVLPWIVVFAAEILFSFMWLLKQPFYWRPVTRTVFPERLPRDEELPGIDVLICTADPKKEPTLDVMNTVISAMTLDYPAEKLSVYLSDDGGASVTLKGMKHAWVFATWWLPFCRKYNLKSICPKAYFGEPEEETQRLEFIKDRAIVKVRYEVFKQKMQSKIGRDDVFSDAKTSAQDHPALVQVINARSIDDDDAATLNPEQVEMMPLLVYVAREKRPSHPHNFKAGALNVLLRVSSTLSNSPYALVLDCDMYCNGSTSAREAMCFYLDPKMSPSLGWVQYPHKFHNVNESDIYDSQMRTLWPIIFKGADGNQGPLLVGTNFYIRREALYDIHSDDSGNNLRELKDCFGPSNEFIKSLGQMYKGNPSKGRELSSVLLQEAEFLSSCTYEKGTRWGEKVGFRYESVVEDVLTGISLQNKGWRSVYLNPTRPQFLGSATTNLNEVLTQDTRWIVGLVAIGLSKHCPLIHIPSKMQFLQKISFSWVVLFPLDIIPVLTFATIQPICFLYGIPLYPNVSNSYFTAFAFVFITSRMKRLFESLSTGGSVRGWCHHELTWMVKEVTSNVYGTLDCVMDKLGLRKASFIPTDKAGDDDKTKYYQMGKYDFRTSNMFLVPFVTLVILNMVCFVGGVVRVILDWSWDTMFAQLLLSLFVLVISFPVIEGMLLRKDSGRVPSSATLISAMVSFVFLSLGYLI